MSPPVNMQSLCPKRERGTAGRKERGKGEPLTFAEHLLHASHGCGCWQAPGWREVNDRREAELMGLLTELSSYSYFLGLELFLASYTCFLSLSLDVIWSWLITSPSGSSLPWGWKLRKACLTYPLRLGGEPQPVRGMDTEVRVLGTYRLCLRPASGCRSAIYRPWRLG